MPVRREKLSVEMILRRSLRDSFNDYCVNCSLAGTRLMTVASGNTRFHRLLWMLIFATGLGTILYFLSYTWHNTLGTPLIVTLESTEYNIGDIRFPAVAICNINRISKNALKEFARIEHVNYKGHGLKGHHHQEAVEKALLNFGRLIDYSYNESLSRNAIFQEMMNKYRHESESIINVMRKLAPQCNNMLIRCAWAGRLVECAKIFNLRRTAHRGHCCTFNYLLNFTATDRWFRKDNEQNFHQETPGTLHGLNLIMDPQIEDYVYPIRNLYGFDVLLFDPMHYADPHAGQVLHRIAEPNFATFMEIRSTKQKAKSEIRKYHRDTRKCLFRDELQDVYFGFYSYSTCLIRCKIETIQSLCRCIPYFMALNIKFFKGAVCTFDHLKCLEKYKEKLIYLYPSGAERTDGLEIELENSLRCDKCLADCELTKHKAKTYSTPLATFAPNKSLFDMLFAGINMTGKSVVSISHPTLDATLIRLDVVYYWYEILSSFGGFCGIIIGLSIASIVEIIYFFTVRYWQHFYENLKKYH